MVLQSIELHGFIPFRSGPKFDGCRKDRDARALVLPNVRIRVDSFQPVQTSFFRCRRRCRCPLEQDLTSNIFF
jgi:hypothetical protein